MSRRFLSKNKRRHTLYCTMVYIYLNLKRLILFKLDYGRLSVASALTRLLHAVATSALNIHSPSAHSGLCVSPTTMAANLSSLLTASKALNSHLAKPDLPAVNLSLDQIEGQSRHLVSQQTGTGDDDRRTFRTSLYCLCFLWA